MEVAVKLAMLVPVGLCFKHPLPCVVVPLAVELCFGVVDPVEKDPIAFAAADAVDEVPVVNRYKNSVPLPIPATSLFCSRSIPKTWVYAQRGNDRRPTLIRIHKHPLWVNPRTGTYAIEN
jgi:hypothetical protein